jgi:hypothetical protein
MGVGAHIACCAWTRDLLISGQAFNARRLSILSINHFMIHLHVLREHVYRRLSAGGGATLLNNRLHALLEISFRHPPASTRTNRDRAQNPHRLSLLGALTTNPPGDSDECVNNVFCLGTCSLLL